METSTLERPDTQDEYEDIIVLDHEPDREIGVYHPGARRLGSMAASAAAGEFLKNTAALVAAGDRPKPPHGHTHDRAEDAEI